MFGWSKDKFDKRDYIAIPMRAAILPDVINWVGDLPEVCDQGSIGSCVGWGIGGNLCSRAKVQGVFSEWFSATWIYNGARYLEGTLSQDAGAMPRDALDFLVSRGCLLEHHWPYTGKLDKHAPPSRLDPEAAKYPLLSYTRVTGDVDGICSALAMGYCVSIGAAWFSKWMNPANDGRLAEVTERDAVAGGHETCLTADTGIPLLDGRTLSIADLLVEYGSDKPFWVYSCDPDGNIVPGKAHGVRKTKDIAKLLKITLDNGEVIRCTADHRFMMRNGGYKQATEIGVGSSLMPLYRNAPRGYELVFNPGTNSWRGTHKIVAENIYGPIDGKVVHHINFEKLDNSPENLRPMTWDDHTNLHAEQTVVLSRYAKSPEGRAKSRELMLKLWEKNRESQYNRIVQNGKKYRERALSEGTLGFQAKEKFDHKEMGKKTGNALRGRKKSQEFCDSVSEGQKISWDKNRDHRLQAALTNLEKAKAKNSLGITEKQREARRNNAINMNRAKWGEMVKSGSPKNHKVVSVEEDGYEPVYDLTVDKYHNFALSAGVFVHNCLFGYDRILKVFFGMNSWGLGWGNKGHYLLPFSAIDAFKATGGYDAHYVDVCWSVVPPVSPTPPEPEPEPKDEVNERLEALERGLAVVESKIFEAGNALNGALHGVELYGNHS